MANKRNFSVFFIVIMVVMVIGLVLLDGSESDEGAAPDTGTAGSVLP